MFAWHLTLERATMTKAMFATPLTLEGILYDT